MENTRSIDVSVAERLKSDQAFRREWFRAALETNVPEIFRDLREARTLTQTDLAALAEMKQAAISRFENSADANWKIETLLRLADALDAQLIITLKTAEEVIADIAREERAGLSVAGSAMSASEPRNYNKPPVLAVNPAQTGPGKKTGEHGGTAEYRGNRGHRPVPGEAPRGRSPGRFLA